MCAVAQRNGTRSKRFATRAIVATRKYASEPRKPSTAPTGPAAAARDVPRATTAIANAAQNGRLPVAKATVVRIRPNPAAMRASRRETPDGPPEPAAATTKPARAARRVPLTSGRAALSEAPTTRPLTM
jgi:hypothetical protein